MPVTIADSLRRVDPSSLPRWKRVMLRPALFVTAVLDQAAHDKLVIRASGLAYASLLAVVPLMAVLFALFVAFGAFEEIEARLRELVLSQLLPARQDEILVYIERFASNTRSLGLFGFIFLIVTAILLLDNIESNFNEIWHVSRRRSLVSKLTAYTSVLVFGSVFLGASLSISARIKAALLTGARPEMDLIGRIGTSLLPLALTFVALLLMYLIIPFGRVRLGPALVGSGVAAVLWELVKNLFASTVGQSVQYSTIYGSLAAIPIFLVWLHLSWIVVLIGLEIAYTHQHFAVFARYRAVEDPPPRERAALALRIFLLVADRWERREPPPTYDQLADRFMVPLEWVEAHVRRLAAAGLVAVASSPEDPAEGVVPSRPLDRLPLAELLAASFDGSAPRRAALDTVETTVDALLDRVRTASDLTLGDATVRDLLAGLEPGADPAQARGPAGETG